MESDTHTHRERVAEKMFSVCKHLSEAEMISLIELSLRWVEPRLIVFLVEVTQINAKCGKKTIMLIVENHDPSQLNGPFSSTVLI